MFSLVHSLLSSFFLSFFLSFSFLRALFHLLLLLFFFFLFLRVTVSAYQHLIRMSTLSASDRALKLNPQRTLLSLQGFRLTTRYPRKSSVPDFPRGGKEIEGFGREFMKSVNSLTRRTNKTSGTNRGSHVLYVLLFTSCLHGALIGQLSVTALVPYSSSKPESSQNSPVAQNGSNHHHNRKRTATVAICTFDNLSRLPRAATLLLEQFQRIFSASRNNKRLEVESTV